MLVKLQVNIEGGFGPTWRREHNATVWLLAEGIRNALTTATNVLAFRDALHNHQAVPALLPAQSIENPRKAQQDK